MLKQILQQKIKEKEHSDKTVIESTDTSITSDIDPDIELVLPMMADGEHEYSDYRFLLKQLKKRNPKAFQKIVNLD